VVGWVVGAQGEGRRVSSSGGSVSSSSVGRVSSWSSG
jgi:hypothetical protein